MVKEDIKFKDLSNNMQTLILIVSGFTVALVIIVFSLIPEKSDLENVARWECHDESYKGFVNRSEVKNCLSTDAIHYKDGPRNLECIYEDYKATCHYEQCYVKDTKEVCEIV